MNRDFTLSVYSEFLKTALEKGFVFYCFNDFIKLQNTPEKYIILRHDVDRKPKNALKFAEIENRLNIKSSFYFRKKEIYEKQEIIKNISSLGHEIGYHYEDLAASKGDSEKAIESFKENLKTLSQIAYVKTMCMHGSPKSSVNNNDLWKKYNYKDFGIIADWAFDTDCNTGFYITDAGRSWNNSEVSLRDKATNKYSFNISSLYNVIEGIKANTIPDNIMINIHPHNWEDNYLKWLKTLYWQSFKNIFKRILIIIRNN